MSKKDLTSAGKAFGDKRIQQRSRRSALIDWILDAPSRNRPISEASLNRGAAMQFDDSAQPTALGQMVADDPVAAAKGVAVGLPAGAGDLLGLFGQGVNAVSGFAQDAIGIPENMQVQFNHPGGDPIREAVGLDPASPAGIVGEVASPVGTIAKTLGIAAKSVTAGAKLAAGTNFDPSLAMVLFHGSPHKFNKFKLESIGTGEGAQAFGHGLYFAENPGVARSYRNKLSNVRSDPTAEEWIKLHGSKEKAIEQAKKDREAVIGQFFNEPAPAGSDRFNEIQEIRNKFGDEALNSITKDPQRLIEEQAVWDQTIKAIEDFNPGSIYEVDIPDSVASKMLDWDAPLSEQSHISAEAIKEAFIKTGPADLADFNARMADNMLSNDPTGEVIQRTFGSQVGNERTSELLAEAGIPGIRFFDGGSRRTVGAGGVRQFKIMPQGKKFEAMILPADDADFAGVLDAKVFDSKAEAAAWADQQINGTRNIVVFNPDDISQVKRDGEIVHQQASRISAGEDFELRIARGEKIAPEELSSEAITATPENGVRSVNDRIEKFLTDDELDLMTIGDRKAMERLLQTSASPEEVASMASAGGAKRGWYEESVKAIKHVFGEEDGGRFASLLAATSPQTSVESNLRNALHIWKNWDRAGRPQDKASILRIMGESVEGNKGIDSVLGAWVPNTLRALTNKNPIDAGLSGPKVDSFMKNLFGQFKEVTQDTWMARALGMSQQKDFSGRNLVKFKDEVGGLGQKKAGYLAGNMLVREAADIMTQRTGRTWTPAEVQETVWSWTKAIWESEGAAGETRRIPQILRAGGVSDDTIRDTPDFASLFGELTPNVAGARRLADNEFQRILKDGGYGKQLESLPESGFGGRGAVSLDPAGERHLESSARRLDRTGRKRGSGTAEDVFQFSKRFVPAGADSGAAPGIYRTTNRRSGTGALSDTPVTQYTLPKEQQIELKSFGVSSTPALNQFDNPKKFHELVSGAKENAGAQSAFLDLKTVDEYAGMQTFATSDGTAGFAIAADGDIVSVFNNKAGKHRGMSPYLLSLAIERGGKKLDAFDGVLVDLYGDMGMVEVNRLPFDPKFAPDDWDEVAFGRPDVVFMELQ